MIPISSNHVQHVNWLNIAVENVKLLIVHSIRRNVGNVTAELHDEELFKLPPPNEGDCPICMIRMPAIISVVDINLVAEKLFAVDVHMLLCMTTKATKLTTKSVPFAERQSLILKRKQ